MTSPNQCGGFGIKNLKTFNKGLLFKWLWRFEVEGEALWRGVITGIYGEMEGKWRTKVITMPFECGVWRNITKGWDALDDNITFRVGRRVELVFWGQQWCGGLVLKDKFPYCIWFHAKGSYLFSKLGGHKGMELLEIRGSKGISRIGR